MRTPFVVLSALASLALAICFLPPLHRSQAQPAPQTSQKDNYYEFTIRNLQVNHAGNNLLNFIVLYRYTPGLDPNDYPDSNQIRQMILNSIHHYPNTTDYWEVFNGNIADGVFAQYENEIDSLRIKMEIAPDRSDPYEHTSIAVRSHAGSAPLEP